MASVMERASIKQLKVPNMMENGSMIKSMGRGPITTSKLENVIQVIG